MPEQIILEGKCSDWYQKAIFILKDEHTKKPPEDLAAFAEDLIENSLKTSSDFLHDAHVHCTSSNSCGHNFFVSHKSVNSFINFFMISGLVSLALIIILYFF